MRLAFVLATVALLCAAAPATATATTPPKACGKVKPGATTYKVRAHLVGCKHARRHARRILRGDSGPRGWSCRRFKPGVTSIRFLCERGARDIYAIRQ